MYPVFKCMSAKPFPITRPRITDASQLLSKSLKKMGGGVLYAVGVDWAQVSKCPVGVHKFRCGFTGLSLV